MCGICISGWKAEQSNQSKSKSHCLTLLTDVYFRPLIIRSNYENICLIRHGEIKWDMMWLFGIRPVIIKNTIQSCIHDTRNKNNKIRAK